MRLLTHNLLACHARNCNAPNNFPLNFKDCTRIEIIEAEFNPDFLKGFLNKIDWKALVSSAKELGDTSLPEEDPSTTATEGSDVELDDELLQNLHHVLLEIHVQDGTMVCPSCGHVYTIMDGIPNMLLAEHEIRRRILDHEAVQHGEVPRRALLQGRSDWHILSSVTSTCKMSIPGRMMYGTAWKKDRTSALVVSAVRAGFRAIDTACQPKHYNQPGVGEALSVLMKEDGIKREDLFIQTKYTSIRGQDPNLPLPYNPDAPLEEQVRLDLMGLGDTVQQSFQTSLRELQTPYIDSLLLHSPEPTVPQTVEAFAALKPYLQSGTLKHIGISNLYDLNFLKKLTGALEQHQLRLKFIQNRFYDATDYDTRIRQFCLENDIEYQSFWTLTANPHILQDRVTIKAAKRLGITVEQALYLFCTQEGITPLNGTTNPSHMSLGVEIGQGDLQLDVNERSAMRKLLV